MSHAAFKINLLRFKKTSSKSMLIVKKIVRLHIHILHVELEVYRYIILHLF